MKTKEIIKVLEELKLYWKGETTLDYIYKMYKGYVSYKKPNKVDENKRGYEKGKNAIKRLRSRN